jgi:hypothetical protein
MAMVEAVAVSFVCLTAGDDPPPAPNKHSDLTYSAQRMGPSRC